MRSPRSQAKKVRGQSMTEILLIVALVGVATIGVVGVMGNNDAAIAGASAKALAGENAKPDTQKAGNLNRTLASFGENEAAAANLDGNYSGMESGLTKPSGGAPHGGIVGTGLIHSCNDGGFGAP